MQHFNVMFETMLRIVGYLTPLEWEFFGEKECKEVGEQAVQRARELWAAGAKKSARFQ